MMSDDDNRDKSQHDDQASDSEDLVNVHSDDHNLDLDSVSRRSVATSNRSRSPLDDDKGDVPAHDVTDCNSFVAAVGDENLGRSLASALTTKVGRNATVCDKGSTPGELPKPPAALTYLCQGTTTGHGG